MSPDAISAMFTDTVMENLFPAQRADHFFEAMYGDVSEGAYDIRLSFHACRPDALELRFNLCRRPDKCLLCSLTYGLPQVFTRHPIINIRGLVSDIDKILNGAVQCGRWELGDTREISADLHVIPLTIFLNSV
jgi:hypothetical protein